MTDVSMVSEAPTSSSDLAQVRFEMALRGAGSGAAPDVLSALDWVQDLYDQPGMEILASVGAMSLPYNYHGVDPDHLFHAMLRQRLISDIAFMYRPGPTPVYHTLIALGSDIAGHPRIVHGGFSSAVIDETTGGLVGELKAAGLLGPGPAFTARLEVKYRAPLPVDSVVCCTATILGVEGRKILVGAEMADRPGGTVFATGKALYLSTRA